MIKIILIAVAGIIIVGLMMVIEAMRRFSRELDNIRFDLEETISKEREERRKFDNTIMVKLHERYDTLVRWIDRLGRNNSNKHSKTERQ